VPERVKTVVRLATADDIPACVQLVVAIGAGSATEWRETLLRTVRDGVDRVLFVAQVADGPVVGYGRVVRAQPPAFPDGWYLLGLVVDPRWRRRGIGAALTAARTRWVAERADRVYYFKHQANRASQDLHTALGFRPVPGEFLPPGGTAEFAETQRLFVADIAKPGSYLST
jgi:GNAT superfamily N-acetyltransferase